MTRFLLTLLALSAAVVACGGDDSDGGGSGSLCDMGCEATLEADCPNGPSDLDACVSACEALSTGSCAEEYTAFQECAAGETLSCDEDSGIPIVEACAAEQGDFIACLND
jgi:hypothetical protein